MTLLPGLVSAVITNDPYPIRFETFVLELLSAEDGHTYLSTSRNYDGGRDGRSVAGSEAAQHIVAATMSQALDEKVLGDIRKLVSKTSLASLTYCTSRNLTELAVDGIGATIRKLVPKHTLLRVFGLVQLRDLAMRHPRILERHYASELADLRTFLSAPGQDETASDVGLRLALQTQVGDDAIALRLEVCARLILEQMLDGKRHSLGDLVAGLSSRLHLPRGILPSFIEPVVLDLVSRGFSASEGQHFILTDAGRAFLWQLGEEAAARLFEGKQAVRTAIDELLGYHLPDTEYERLWPVFRDGMAELVHMHGAAIIEMVSSLQSDTTVADDNTFRAARERLADRISMLFSNDEQRTEIYQAVIDLFSRRGTKAFEWLSSVCVVYVMMCSLGIESRSAQEIGRILQTLTLLPDTDIVLSLLCEGEDKHSEISKVLNGWRLMGGAIAVPTPVLEEVAYHAWIADQEFLSSRELLGKLSEDRAEYLVANAFVRTFRKQSPDPLSLPLWNRFMQEFRGRAKYDHSKIVELLRSDFSIEPVGAAVSEADATGDPFFAPVRRHLLEFAAREANCAIDELDDIQQDKARRDAILLTELALLRQRLRGSGNPGSMIIVSSARALRQAGAHFREQLDRPDPVITIPAVATMLALTPGVGMGVQSLKALLFDTRLAKRLSPLERFAYRVLEQSGQYTLGLSRRGSLRRRLREELVAQAQRTGRRPREEERELMAGNDPAGAARVVGGALRTMALQSDAEAKILAQQARIQELERELHQLRSQM